MADAPVVFTSEEQLLLQQLESQVNGFNGFKNLVARSLYQGQDAPTAVDLQNFLSNLVSQATEQVKKIQAAAKERNSKPVESATISKEQ